MEMTSGSDSKVRMSLNCKRDGIGEGEMGKKFLFRSGETIADVSHEKNGFTGQ